MANPFSGLLGAFGVPMKSDPATNGATGATPPVRTPSPVAERTGGLDIFVGGGADNWIPGGGIMDGYAKDYRAQTGRPTRYLPNSHILQIVDAIREGNERGGPVNVVGHSWGGPDAYNAVAQAAARGLHVDNLITLDPVSGPFGGYDGPPRAKTWLNVTAAPSHPDYTDQVTTFPGLAHKPSRLPIDLADQSATLDLNHRDAGQMMAHSGGRALLDQSRQFSPSEGANLTSLGTWPPTAQSLHDNLPMMDWMRARQAEVAGGSALSRP